jgi:cytochrome c oxidase subunit 2
MRPQLKIISIAVLALLFSLASANAQDLVRGQQIYKLCSACHGENGQGNQSHSAPAIAGMAPWYIELQLQKFQAGLRGYHAEDLTGLQMRPMARALKSDEDLKSVATYVSQLTPTQPTMTLVGDAARGKDLYGTCSACHGLDGKGNEAIKAPSLLHQLDWYLVSQLKKYRDGLRGAHKDDVGGAPMRAMTMLLQDEQSLNDIAAYVLSLEK